VSDFNLSDGKKELYEIQLRSEMETLWNLPSDVVMLSEINPHWADYLRTTIPNHWQIRHDDEDVALMWNTRVCKLVANTMDKELSFPDEPDSMKLNWRSSLQGVFEVVDPSISAGQFHFVAATHTHANNNSKDKKKEYQNWIGS